MSKSLLQDPAQAIEAAYPRLSPRMKKAARYIQKHPGDVALYPLRHVAAEAQVSPTTLVRLAGDLGYASYNGMKDAFRAHMRLGSGRYAERAGHILGERGGGDQQAFKTHIGRTISQALDELFAGVTPQEIEETSRLLHESRRVYVLGMRSMFAPALTLSYLLRTFRKNIVLLTAALDMLVDELLGIGPEDTLVAISFDPYSIAAVQAAHYARDSGAAVIAVTDTSFSPFAQGAAQVYRVPPPAPSFYQSMAPVTALLETFAAFTLLRAGDGALEQITKEYERRDAFGAYWRDGG